MFVQVTAKNVGGVFLRHSVVTILTCSSSVIAHLSTSFGWGKGGKVTAGGWQVTMCDPIWHVISCSGVVKLYTVYFTV